MPSTFKLAGQFINNGRLQLLEVLGNGTYGTVYRTLDTSSVELPKQVYYAVKVTLNRRSKDPVPHSREFALHKSVCEHPNIISVHDIICDDTYRYVVLAYCPDGDLYTPITRCRFYLQDDLVKSTFMQLLDAVHHCHEKGVFHRDIKPENILCSANSSKVFLADFGLATKREVSNNFGCGTQNYMSPECCIDEIEARHRVYCTRRADIWALGVVFVNMLTGGVPWQCAIADDPCFAEFMEDRDYLLHTYPISKGANTLLKHMLDLDPLTRHTLPKLRDEILKVDTFFLTEDELKNALPNLRAVAEYYRSVAEGVAAKLTRGIYKQVDVNASDSDSDDSYDSDSSDDDFGSVHFVMPTRPLQQSVFQPDVVFRALGSEFSIGTDSSSSSTEDDSDGPITPETSAVGLDIEVPDLLEGQSLNKSDIVPIEIPTRTMSSPFITVRRKQPPIKKTKSSPFTAALHKALRLIKVTHH